MVGIRAIVNSLHAGGSSQETADGVQLGDVDAVVDRRVEIAQVLHRFGAFVRGQLSRKAAPGAKLPPAAI
jgi:hypothetical protein